MMTPQQAVEALDAINVSDPELAHVTADNILRILVPSEVEAALDRLYERAPWWASA